MRCRGTYVCGMVVVCVGGSVGYYLSSEPRKLLGCVNMRVLVRGVGGIEATVIGACATGRVRRAAIREVGVSQQQHTG